LREWWVIGDGCVVQPTVNVLVAGLVLVFFVVPLIRGAVQALSERDAWAPFATRADGRGGHLAPGRYFAALRAPRPGARTTTGLLARWCGWVAVTLALVVGVVQSVLSSVGASA
jgi:hypothetical protein